MIIKRESYTLNTIKLCLLIIRQLNDFSWLDCIEIISKLRHFKYNELLLMLMFAHASRCLHNYYGQVSSEFSIV